jgi:hypothetical protein
LIVIGSGFTQPKDSILRPDGRARGANGQMSQSFLGKQIDGIWHTGVVVFGKEFFFGGGIQHGTPGRTPYGVPVERLALGDSHIPEDVFLEFLQEISSRFSMDSYDLLHNNCNNFTNECSIFLTGSPIPEYITALPSQVLNTPMGQLGGEAPRRVRANTCSPYARFLHTRTPLFYHVNEIFIIINLLRYYIYISQSINRFHI